mgnify:CR=1 FL=1
MSVQKTLHFLYCPLDKQIEIIDSIISKALKITQPIMEIVDSVSSYFVTDITIIACHKPVIVSCLKDL